MSDEGIKKRKAEFDESFDKLKSFDRDDLTESQQLTYDILNQYLETESEGYLNIYLSEPFSPMKGLQSNISTYFTDYRFDDKGDVERYLQVLGMVRDYFDDNLEFEKTKSEKGYFMSDAVCDKVIEQCEDFIKDKDNHFMIQVFNDNIEALDFLTADEIADFEEQNMAALAAKGAGTGAKMEENGIEKGKLTIQSAALKKIINNYTKEAGVRNLERTIGQICRKTARLIMEEDKKKVTVTSKNLSDFLGKEHFNYLMANKKDEIGISRGLACNYDGEGKFHTTIGDYAFIGCNTNLVAPVTVGDHAFTAAGSTIGHDVPAGALSIERAKQAEIEGWGEKKLEKYIAKKQKLEAEKKAK